MRNVVRTPKVSDEDFRILKAAYSAFDHARRLNLRARWNAAEYEALRASRGDLPGKQLETSAAMCARLDAELFAVKAELDRISRGIMAKMDASWQHPINVKLLALRAVPSAAASAEPTASAPGTGRNAYAVESGRSDG